MAGDIEIASKVFGTRELVEGLGTFGKQLRLRVFGALKTMARAYAVDVASTGLSEQGIQSRTDRLAKSFRTTGRLGAAEARVIVYPNATDPDTKYRYPWALGKGSPKNEINVRPHVRRAAVMDTYAIQRRRRGARLGVSQAIAVQTSAGISFVKAHRRRIRMAPRPFMAGSAFNRLQAQFAAKMEAAVQRAVAEAQYAESVLSEFDSMGGWS